MGEVHLAEAVRLFEALGDIESTGQAAWAFVYLAAWRADTGRAVEVAERGLAMVGEEASPTRCRLMGAMAMATGAAGDAVEAHRQVARALAELDRGAAISTHGAEHAVRARIADGTAVWRPERVPRADGALDLARRHLVEGAHPELPVGGGAGREREHATVR